MKRSIVVAAVIAVLGSVQCAQAEPLEISLPALLTNLYELFGREVKVEGVLTGWGEMAALDSEVTREVMVDLRPLAADIRERLNSTCTVDRHCSATVLGKISHIRGPAISELGIAAASIDFAPLPDKATLQTPVETNTQAVRN